MRYSLVIIFQLLFCATLFAQDSQYWTNQFGLRGNLLSGALVGGVRDTSATFYNPGALAFIREEELSVSANAFRIESVSYDNGAGTGDDLDSDELNVLPLLLSGMFRFEGVCDCHTFGYTILTRSYTTVNASDRRDSIADVVSNSAFPGSEDYIGQYTLDTKQQEYWGGLSYGYQFADHYSFGFSNFLALRSQSFNERTSARAVNLAIAATSDNSRYYDFDNLRALWKVGLAGDYEDVKFGVTLTTPSINVYGDGTSSRDFTVNNVDIDGDGSLDSFVANDRQEDLDAEIRSPLSVAAGFEYAILERTNFAASIEWFLTQGRYGVLNPESGDFVRPAGAFTGLFNSREFLQVSDAADQVVNFAVGIEQILSDRFNGYLSFRSDYSRYKTYGGEGSGLGISDWDIYHVTIGGSYRGVKSEIGVGVTYSFGHSDDVTQVANFSDPEQGNFLVGERGDTSVDYDAVSLLLGYSYYFS